LANEFNVRIQAAKEIAFPEGENQTTQKGKILTHAILPASGSATRMRGLPKFLLPCDKDYLSLVERHIDHLLEYCETVWLPVRPDLVHLVESLRIPEEHVVILAMATQSMTDTVKKVVEMSSGNRFVLAMPDTYFYGELPYQYLVDSKDPMSLACWKIRPEQYGKLGQVEISPAQTLEPEPLLFPEGFVTRAEDKNPECRYPYSWGAMAFDREMMEFASAEMPHTGYLLPKILEQGIPIGAKVMDGEYFDCGTPAEYLEMLKKVTN
jgi:hypothetical protein